MRFAVLLLASLTFVKVSTKATWHQVIRRDIANSTSVEGDQNLTATANGWKLGDCDSVREPLILKREIVANDNVVTAFREIEVRGFNITCVEAIERIKPRKLTELVKGGVGFDRINFYIRPAVGKRYLATVNLYGVPSTYGNETIGTLEKVNWRK